MLKVFRLTFLFGGLSVIILSLIVLYKRNDPNRLYFENVSVETTYASQKTVSGIEIKDLAISLPIILSHKNGNIWETTPSGVSYLVSSPLPGEPGNSIMYGHNWGSILGRLDKARPGQKVTIYYSDGTKNEFEIKAVNEVSPNDSSLLSQSEERKLTIYTCSGLFDEKRVVVTAFLL